MLNVECKIKMLEFHKKLKIVTEEAGHMFTGYLSLTNNVRNEPVAHTENDNL